MHYFLKEATAVFGSAHQVIVTKKMQLIVVFLLLCMYVAFQHAVWRAYDLQCAAVSKSSKTSLTHLTEVHHTISCNLHTDAILLLQTHLTYSRARAALVWLARPTPSNRQARALRARAVKWWDGLASQTSADSDLPC